MNPRITSKVTVTKVFRMCDKAPKMIIAGFSIMVIDSLSVVIAGFVAWQVSDNKTGNS